MMGIGRGMMGIGRDMMGIGRDMMGIGRDQLLLSDSLYTYAYNYLSLMTDPLLYSKITFTWGISFNIMCSDINKKKKISYKKNPAFT